MFLLKYIYGKRFSFITFLKEVFERRIYTSKSYDVVHDYRNKRFGQTRATLYYNQLGRLFFLIRQVIALITNGKLFKKEIKLEGFDDIDYKNLHSHPSVEAIWPPSPFAESSRRSVNPELFSKFELSYKLAYERDPHNLPQSKWWSENSELYRKHFLSNGKLNVDRLTRFRQEKVSEADLIKDQARIIDKTSYFKSYLQAIDLVLEYHRISPIVDRALLASVSESFAGNNLCPIYRGKRLSNRLLTNSAYLSGILAHVDFDRKGKNVILDLGGGYGGLARLMKYYVPNSCYILIELPEVCVFASYFLKYSFPDAKIAFLDNFISNGEDPIKFLSDYDFLILPTWCIEKLPELSVDLIINTASLGEMSKEYGRYYMGNISRVLKKNGYFYSANRLYSGIEQYGDFGFYNWNFQDRYLILSQRNLHHGLSEWVGKRLSI